MTIFPALSVGPLVSYSLFLYLWIGTLSSGGNLTPLPFAGLAHGPYRLDRRGIDFAFVVLPTLLALAALVPDRRSPGEQRWLPCP